MQSDAEALLIPSASIPPGLISGRELLAYRDSQGIVTEQGRLRRHDKGIDAVGETGAVVLIRTARLEDAERLAWIHVRCWQQAYAGLLPADYLDNLMDELPRRTERWLIGISSAPPWVAESDVGEVFGFATWGASHDGDATSRTTGEVYGIYVLAEHWNTGAGRRLMEAALGSLKEAGFAEATLWVLDRNVRARRFYEAGGWAPDGATKIDKREGFVLNEMRYRRRLNREPISDMGGKYH